MKVTTKKLPKSEFLFTIEAEKGDLDKYIKDACKDISSNMRVSGFRPGHVPYDILANHVGKEYIEMVAQEKAAAKMYSQAVTDENLMPIASADFKVLNKDPFTFEIKVVLLPEVTIKGLEKIMIKKEKVEIKDKDIEDVIKELQIKKSRFEDMDRKVEKGDRVEISFEGFDAKSRDSLPNTNSKNHPVVIGDNTLVPGFEDNLIGLKKDDEKEFEVTFPKDYHATSMQSKKVKFKVKVNRTEKRIMPELDETFAESVYGKKISIEELKKYIKENLEHEKIHHEIKRQEEEFLKQLKRISELEISDILIDREVEGLMSEHTENAKKYNIEWSKYLEIFKKTEEALKKELRESAISRLTNSLIIENALKYDNITLEAGELERNIKTYIASLPKKEQYKAEKEYKKDSSQYRAMSHNLKVKKLFQKHIEGYEHSCS